MHAIIRSRYGGPDVLDLKDIPEPTPKKHEVLVRVHTCTVNRTDCGVLWGAPYIFRFFVGWPRPPAVLGTDFAGEVVQVGSAVTRFQPGDRVFGFNDNGAGSYAELMTFPETGGITTIPEGISYETAAASAEGAHYAYNYLRKLHMGGGHKIMLNGGTGAIGSAAMQMLKYRGATVVATAPTGHLEQVKALGADRVIDYQQEDFTQDDDRYHFVFDAVGKSSFGQCKRLLLPQGYYTSSELGPHAENPLRALLAPLQSGKKVAFPTPSDTPQSLAYVRELLAQKAFRPLIDRRYPMTQVAEAFTYVNSGQKIGNVLLEIT